MNSQIIFALLIVLLSNVNCFLSNSKFSYNNHLINRHISSLSSSSLLSSSPKKENDILMKPIKNTLRNAILTILISSSLSSSPVLASNLPDIDSDNDVTSTITTTTANNNAVRIISTTNINSDKKKAITTSDDDDLSYSTSLAKEQKKQEARKKSKSDRSKDLCESLGRGC